MQLGQIERESFIGEPPFTVCDDLQLLRITCYETSRHHPRYNSREQENLTASSNQRREFDKIKPAPFFN